MVKLEDVAEINPRTPKHIADDDDVAFVPMSAISEDGSLDEHGTKPYAEVKKGYTYFERGDVLVAKITPCFENGKAALVDNLIEPIGFGSTEFHVLRPGPDVDGRYLFYMLWSEKFRAVATVGMTGSAGQKRVPVDLLRRTEIRLPPLEEQRRIAAILDKADALRQKRKRAIALLDSLTQSIFLEMFGDPVTNPKGWKQAKLGDLCGVGSSKRVFAREFAQEGVPFYRGTEVGKLGAGESTQADLYISPEHYDRLIQESGKPEIGDLLLPSICHDGRIWRVDNSHQFYFKDGRVLWIKSHAADINAEYLRNQLRNMFLHNYHSIASGTTFAELKIVNLKKLLLLYPPKYLQDEFSGRISKVERRKLEFSHSEKACANLFASLQHRAFSGQL